MRDTFEKLLAMLKAPFVGDLDLWHLFLLVGVVLIFAAIWAIILQYAKTANIPIIGDVT